MPQWQCRGCRKWKVGPKKPPLAQRTCSDCSYKHDTQAAYVGPPDGPALEKPPRSNGRRRKPAKVAAPVVHKKRRVTRKAKR